MVTIKCDTCEVRFSVEDQYIQDGKVHIAFHCPYCAQAYPVGYRVRIREIGGGVNISGQNVSVKGSIVGRDLYEVKP